MINGDDEKSIILIPLLQKGLKCFLSFIGLAYDLKTVSADMIRQRVNRTGDGTHAWSKETVEDDGHHHPENPIWGWDDTDMTEEEKQFAEIVHRKTE